MNAVKQRSIDADNHYYAPLDAFTRYQRELYSRARRTAQCRPATSAIDAFGI
jgi:hypothetical protein